MPDEGRPIAVWDPVAGVGVSRGRWFTSRDLWLREKRKTMRELGFSEREIEEEMKRGGGS